METGDAKRTNAYFISYTSLGPIMQLLVLLGQYQFLNEGPTK